MNYNQAEFTDGYAFLKWFISFGGENFFDVSSKHMPVYPLLIKIPALFLDPVLAGRLISALAGFFCLFPIYQLCLEVYGERTALLATILFTVSAQILFLTTRVLSEPLFLAFSFTAILHAFRLFSDQKINSLPWLILFSGLAGLTRPEGLTFVPLWIFGLIQAFRRRHFKSVLLSLPPLLLWFGYMLIVPQGGATYGSDMSRSLHSLSSWRLFRNLWMYVEIYPYVIFFPVLIFAGYNLFSELTPKRKVWLMLIAYVHVSILTVLSVFWAWTTRFLALPISVLLIEAAAGMDRFANRLPKWFSKCLIFATIVGSSVFAMIALHYQKDTFADIKNSAQYIRSHFPDSRIFSNDPFKVSCYTNGEVNKYEQKPIYRSGDIIALHSFYGDLERDVTWLTTHYQVEEVFRTDSVVIPVLANTIITKGSNTPEVAARRFHGQTFTSVVLRISGKDERRHSGGIDVRRLLAGAGVFTFVLPCRQNAGDPLCQPGGGRSS
ncbi:glycosyltransferase family 39 protein [bacterium]|nr:glycosyltransferase family 39 protein [bacterium]MCI0605100.1 glycosyltransferase family 39 protein [bacterium]